MAKLSHGAFKTSAIENAVSSMLSAKITQLLSVAIQDGQAAVGSIASEVDSNFRLAWVVVNSKEFSYSKEVITEFTNEATGRAISTVGVFRMDETDMTVAKTGIIGGQKITRQDFMFAPLAEVLDAVENLDFFGTNTTRDLSSEQYTTVQNYVIK